MRSRYWSGSKLADWIRGEPKPTALTMEGWDAWDTEQQAKRPVRFWIAETALDWVQGVVFYVPDRIRDVVYWYHNRFVYRSHTLVAHPNDIKPGTWAPVWERVFFSSFNALVDFVEVEKALENVRWDIEARTRYTCPRGMFRWPYLRGWRSAEAGLDYLRWEANLGDDCAQQREQAREIIELYNWWKEVRPNRVPAGELSGWDQWVLNRKPLSRQFQDDIQREESSQIMDRLEQIQQDYDSEDVLQLTRLVKLQWGLR